MGSKTIKVSGYVYEKLMELKENEGHTTLDSVIRTLLNHNIRFLAIQRKVNETLKKIGEIIYVKEKSDGNE